MHFKVTINYKVFSYGDRHHNSTLITDLLSDKEYRFYDALRILALLLMPQTPTRAEVIQF